jgi:hypothetical protein
VPEAKPATASDAGSGGRLIKAGQIAGAITAIVTAAALLYNDVLKPAPAPAVLTAAVTQVEAHPGVTFGNYLNAHTGQLAQYRANAKAAGIETQEVDEALAAPGVLVEYTIELHGPAGRAVNVASTLYEAHTEARVPESKVRFLPPERYIARAGVSEAPQSTWIARPAHAGAYYVEIELTSTGREPVAHRASPVFTVSR